MPINSSINQDLNTIIRTVTGELTGTDVKTAFTESLSHPDFKTNMHVIWDLTDADVSKISIDQLMDVVRHIRTNIDNRGANYKILIVAPIDISFGMSRMFEGVGHDLPQSIHILRELDAAYKLIEGQISP